MTVIKDDPPVKLEVECKYGSQRAACVCFFVFFVYVLLMNAIYNHSEATRELIRKHVDATGAHFERLYNRMHELHTEDAREHEYIRRYVEILTQRLDAWKVPPIETYDAHPGERVENIFEPVIINDKHDLHYWTCNGGGWCVDVLQTMVGQYEIYECMHNGCKSLAGNPKNHWLKETRDDYAYWAVGRDTNSSEWIFSRIGVENRAKMPLELHECNKFSCRQLAFRRI